MSSSSASSRAMTSPMTAASLPPGGSRPPMTWIAPRTPARGFHLVGDDGRHLAEPHERRLLAQLLVGRPQALLGALAHDDAGQGARERAEELLLCRFSRMPGFQIH